MDAILDWDPVVADLAPALYRYFCASFASEVADDCVQDTLIRLIEKVRSGKFDAKRGNLRMYAFGIAHFVRLERIRVRAEFADMPDEGPSQIADQEEKLHENRQRQILQSAIRTLPEVQKQVLSLYLDEELSLDEIGTILAMPGGTVKSHIFRAKQSLKDALAKYQEVGNERPR